MSNYVRVPGLVAERMSQSLANKFWQKPDPYEIHINADGDNSTADGTKENPFANLDAAITYSLDNSMTRVNKGQSFVFDTDYTAGENEGINMSGFSGHFIINGNGHNVVLRRAQIKNMGGGMCSLITSGLNSRKPCGLLLPLKQM